MIRGILNRATPPLVVLGASLVMGGGCNNVKKPGESGGAEAMTAVVVDAVPLDDPGSTLWVKSPEVIVELMPQGVAFPMLTEVTVPKLSVRVLRDETHIAFKLEWPDVTKSDMLEVDEFSDGVAIELPLADPGATNPMMGTKENPVYIAHWKAVWQRDVDVKRADVQDYHPGFWSDPYPFVRGAYPYPIEEAFETANARRYLPGIAAGNPVSALVRRQPVEELQAEGFSTLADHHQQDAKAKGKHADGKWRVVIALPLQVSDAANPKFPSGGEQKVAFAVWDGGSQNVAGRKQWYPWVTLKLP